MKIYVSTCNGNSGIDPSRGKIHPLSKVGHLDFKTDFFFLLILGFFLLLLPNTHRMKSQSKRSPNKFTICQWSYWCSQPSSGVLEAVIQNLGSLLLYPVVCMLWKTNQKHLSDSSKYYSKQLMYWIRNRLVWSPSNAIPWMSSHGMERINWSRETKGTFPPTCAWGQIIKGAATPEWRWDPWKGD